jgi:WD40 repeat protein
MDYFQGQTLEGYVKEHGPLPVEDVLAVARQVAEGLQAAHGAKVLHRDVKPANLLVRKEAAGWKVKVIDFGLALPQKVVETSQKASTVRQKETRVGSSVAGTLDYGAPEQMGRRKEPVGRYSDVYGWAKTCCYALFQTTQPTFRHWQSVPEPLAELLGRCLEEDPKKRPQGFAEVLKGLDTGAASSAAASVVPEQGFDFDTPQRQAAATAAVLARTKKPKKGVLPWVLGGLGLLAMALVVVLGFMLGGPKKKGLEGAGREEKERAGLLVGRGEKEPSDQAPRQVPSDKEGRKKNVVEPPLPVESRPTGQAATQVPSDKEGQKKDAAEPPLPVEPRPAAFSGAKRFRFTDEEEINRDWTLARGNSSWRIEGEGLKLTDQGALLESKFSVRGDLRLEMNYDMLPRCEIWVTIWGQRFEFKADGSKAATLHRTGDTVVFGSGSGPRTTLKLKSSQARLSTPITIRLDGLNLYRPRMELLVRSIGVSTTTLPSEQGPSGDGSGSPGGEGTPARTGTGPHPLPSAQGPKPGTLQGHTAYVKCLAFSPDGKTLVSGSHDKTVRVWDVAAGKEVAVFTGHTNGVAAVAFSPDGRTVASASADGTVRVLDAATGSELERFQGHTGGVLDVAFFPDGKTLLSCGVDKTIRRWARGRAAALDTLDNGAAGRYVAVAPDGKTFASTCRGVVKRGADGKTFVPISKGGVKLWKVGEKRSWATLSSPKHPYGEVLSISYFPDGKSLIGNTQEVTIWDVQSGKATPAIKSSWQTLHILRLNSTGEYLATSSISGQGATRVQEVKLFDVRSGKELATLHRASHLTPFLGIAFSPDSSTLAVGNQDGTISLLDIARYTGRPAAAGADGKPTAGATGPSAPPVPPTGNNRSERTGGVPGITPALQKKLHGQVAYNQKTGELTLTYDFKDEDQLKDFDAGTDKPVIENGTLRCQGAEAIKHVVHFKTLKVSSRCCSGREIGTGSI